MLRYCVRQKASPSLLGAAVPDFSRFIGGLPMNRTAMSNLAESVFQEIRVPVTPDRRRLDRLVAHLPIRILSVDGNPVFYPAICTNLSGSGIGLATTSRLEVGRVMEFELCRRSTKPSGTGCESCFAITAGTVDITSTATEPTD